jgi:hypothetical protein
VKLKPIIYPELCLTRMEIAVQTLRKKKAKLTAMKDAQNQSVTTAPPSDAKTDRQSPGGSGATPTPGPAPSDLDGRT